jgi:hypothetical protein
MCALSLNIVCACALALSPLFPLKILCVRVLSLSLLSSLSKYCVCVRALSVKTWWVVCFLSKYCVCVCSRSLSSLPSQNIVCACALALSPLFPLKILRVCVLSPSKYCVCVCSLPLNIVRVLFLSKYCDSVMCSEIKIRYLAHAHISWFWRLTRMSVCNSPMSTSY